MQRNNAGTRRSRIEILKDILDCIEKYGDVEGARKTDIAQCSNLNMNSLKRYLKLLENIGAISVTKAGRYEYVVLTPHGLLVKVLIERVMRLLDMHTIKPYLVKLGLRMFGEIHNVGRLRSLPSDYLGVLIDNCEFIVGGSGLCIVCLREAYQGRVEIVCCTFYDNRGECKAIDSISPGDPLDDDAIRRLVMRIRVYCCTK